MEPCRVLGIACEERGLSKGMGVVGWKGGGIQSRPLGISLHLETEDLN